MRASFLCLTTCGFLSLCAYSLGFAQPVAPPPFDPFPAGAASSYHFDLARNFFRSPDEEAAARRALVARLARFDQRSREAVRTAESLLTALRLQDALDREATRHIAYLELRFNADTRQPESLKAAGELRGSVYSHLAAFNSALAALPEPRLARFEKARPELKRYRFFIESSRREASHRLGPEAERVLAATAPLATDWGGSLFLATMASTDFGVVHTPDGDLSVARDYTAIAASPDGRVRREGHLRNEAGLAQHQTTYATILVQQAVARNTLAQQRRYADYADESYGARFLDRNSVLALLNSLAEASEVNKRFEKLFIDHLRRVHHLDSVHFWDQYLPEPGMDLPRFTIGEATRLVVEAMRPLGPDYSIHAPCIGSTTSMPSCSRSGISINSIATPWGSLVSIRRS